MALFLCFVHLLAPKTYLPKSLANAVLLFFYTSPVAAPFSTYLFNSSYSSFRCEEAGCPVVKSRDSEPVFWVQILACHLLVLKVISSFCASVLSICKMRIIIAILTSEGCQKGWLGVHEFQVEWGQLKISTIIIVTCYKSKVLQWLMIVKAVNLIFKTTKKYI